VTVDDLGYEEPAVVAATPPTATPPAEVTPPVEKVVSGYGKEEPVVPAAEVTPPVEVKKPEDMTPEEKAQKEITDTIKDLGPGYNKDKISKFVTENKLTKEQVSAYIKLTKDEDAEFAKTQAEAVTATRKAWKQELMSDPEFGGEHFDKNVDRVEKVLNNMPNTKKMLTEKGGVLPPYLMKDLLSLAKTLNPTVPLVMGEAPAPDEESDDDFLNDMYPTEIK
jgi:hypothetical protein